MMKVKITEGMRFQHNPYQKGNQFRVVLYDFFDDGCPIWCAVADGSIVPLSEIIIENYIPMVDGKWVNEPVEYEY